MTTLFISDLHIGLESPLSSQCLVDFLATDARAAEKLYILGDLFEAWIGDDAIHPAYQGVLDALKALTNSGVPVFYMHGNRDFLISKGFEEITGCQIITDPTVISLYGTATLLMHGDTLCTEDTEYQAFRKIVRDPTWQADILARSPAERIAIAGKYREASREKTKTKSEEITDVTQATVEAVMAEHKVTQLIHGHTHRPNIHHFTMTDPVINPIINKEATRIVLGDWYTQGSVLTVTNEGYQLNARPFE